jgi:hypothetical protein
MMKMLSRRDSAYNKNMRLNKAADMASVVMLSVAMLNVVAPEKAIECLDNKNKKKFSVLELML